MQHHAMPPHHQMAPPPPPQQQQQQQQQQPPPPLRAPPLASRMPELLDSLRHEADILVNDLAQYKHRNDDLEAKYNAQTHELIAFQQHLYDLERTHGKLKQQYEEEIQRLHKELDIARGGSGNIPPVTPSVDRYGYKSNGPPNYPENIPPPVLTSGENGNGVFGALMGGGNGSGVNLPDHRGGPDTHPAKRVRGEDGPPLHPSQQQHPSHQGPPPQQSPYANKPPGAPLRQDYVQNPTHSPGHEEMKRKLPPQGHPDQYRQGPPPLHIQGKPQQYPPPPHGYSQGPPPPQQPMYQQQPPMQQQQPPPPPAYQQIPPQQQQMPVQRTAETGICDLDGILSSANPALAQWKKQGPDWTVVYNPKSATGKGKLDVSLAHSFDHGSVVCCLKFSNDGLYLATGCNRTAQVFDARTGVKLHTLTATSDLVGGTQPPNGDLYIRSVCFSPDSLTLATGAEDKVIRVWDINSRTLRYSLRGHEQDIYSMDWSKDGRFLVSGSGDRSVRVWDASDPSGGKCLMALFNEEDTAPNLAQTQKDSGVTSVAISPIDGRCIAAASLDMKVRIWDLRTGRLLERFEGHKDSVYSVSFSQDGRSIVSASLDKTLKVWDLSPQTLATLSRPPDHGVLPHANPTAPHSSPAAHIVTTRSRHTYGGHRNYVLSVAYPGVGAAFARSPDGSRTGLEDIEWVVSASKDRTITFWDAKPGAGAAGGGDLTSCAQFMLQGHKNSGE
ncbi:general transcription repressor [Physocladia obscura]|uniref:General transcription repressor n=1 Tax=Physocladia obscura TaxID=109957 RepID=A0AAD5XE07_9FUNG|nr:general transcription repressor [Physocladia obscura]